MTPAPRMTTRRHEGCKALNRHSGGDPWVCRGCGKKACGNCVQHYWSAKAGHVVSKPGGLVFEGKRVATCQGCKMKGVLPAPGEACF